MFQGVTRRASSATLLVTVLATCVPVAGCTFIAEHVAEILTRRHTRSIVQSVKVPVSQTEAFQSCLHHPGPGCGGPSVAPKLSPDADLREIRSVLRYEAVALPEEVRGSEPGAQEAVNQVLDLLNDDVSLALQAAAYRVSSAVESSTRSPGDDPGPPTIELTSQKLDGFTKKLEAAVADGAFEITEHALTKASARLDARSTARLSRSNSFLKAYFSAYFRNGQFLKISADDTTWTGELKRSLRARLPGLSDAEIEEIVNKMRPQSGYVFGAISETGFVTRTGTEYRFPGVSVSFDPLNLGGTKLPKIDTLQVLSELVRVYVEAVSDAISCLPGVSNSTGVTAGLLAAHDPDHSTVSADEFREVVEFSNRLDAVLLAGVGQLVRGGGPVALNNEALARLIETFAGVTARKTAERIGWCLYASRPPKVLADRMVTLGPATEVVHFDITLEEPELLR